MNYINIISKLVLYNVENKIDTNNVIRVELERPKNYYYDKYDFGDFLF